MNCILLNKTVRMDSYKKYLQCIQGNSSDIIPLELIDKIKQEFCKNNELTERDTMTYGSVKKFLKKTGDLRCDVYKILKMCGSSNLCKFSGEDEVKLEKSFEDVSGALTRILPDGMTISFNHPYITKKMTEKHCITVPERAFPIPIMFNLEKLISYDKLWKQVCHRLGWKFIPSEI